MDGQYMRRASASHPDIALIIVNERTELDQRRSTGLQQQRGRREGEICVLDVRQRVALYSRCAAWPLWSLGTVTETPLEMGLGYAGAAYLSAVDTGQKSSYQGLNYVGCIHTWIGTRLDAYVMAV